MGRSSKKVCKIKVKHKDRLSAEEHAARLAVDRNKPHGTWHAYNCPWCDGYHIGRPSWRKLNGHREPLNITLYNEIGHRAYWCGVYENHPVKAVRFRTIRHRAIKALMKSTYGKKRTTPLP